MVGASQRWRGRKKIKKEKKKFVGRKVVARWGGGIV